MKVVFLQRNPGKQLFSIERLFDSIRAVLPDSVEACTTVSGKFNSGIFNKLYNMAETLFVKQGDVNHVTGDVHYLTLFLKKRKTILTIHDVNLMYSSNGVKKALHRWLWLQMPMNRAEIVTVISQTTKEELLKYVKYPSDKIRVVYNCISNHFTPHPKAFNKENPTILHIGVAPHKNLHRLASALKGINCNLHIIGKPPEAVIALLEENKIRYEWKVNLTDEEMLNEYIQADMLVFASTFEGFGLPIIEANTIERPVVTSNVSAMKEVAGDGACLVDPFDVDSIRNGILRVIQDDAYRERLISDGRKNRERFSPKLIAQTYASLYEELHLKVKQ